MIWLLFGYLTLCAIVAFALYATGTDESNPEAVDLFVKVSTAPALAWCAVITVCGDLGAALRNKRLNKKRGP